MLGEIQTGEDLKQGGSSALDQIEQQCRRPAFALMSTSQV
jgi:hypothetical protein